MVMELGLISWSTNGDNENVVVKFVVGYFSLLM